MKDGCNRYLMGDADGGIWMTAGAREKDELLEFSVLNKAAATKKMVLVIVEFFVKWLQSMRVGD